jgi:hypothetical protein
MEKNNNGKMSNRDQTNKEKFKKNTLKKLR